LESSITKPERSAAHTTEASTPVNGFIFDDDDLAHIDSDDETLKVRAEGRDYDGFFLHDDPRETYAFEGTRTETAVNVVNGLYRARRVAGDIATSVMTSRFPPIPFRNPPEKTKKKPQEATEEGRQMTDVVKDLAGSAMRAATEVVNAVPPLDLQTGQAPGGKRR
jgi:hypothetical protein